MHLWGLMVAAVLLAAPLGAEAQSFRCVGKDGRHYYGSIIPTPCIGQPVEQLNPHGVVIKRIDPEATEKERLAREAEAARKREQEAAAREAARRNRALLATYSSLKDIDEARSRALADNDKAAREIEERIETLRKRQSGFEREMEFFQGRNKPPAKLLEDIQGTEVELKLQQAALEAKRREVDGIVGKFDEDRRRYVELTRTK